MSCLISVYSPSTYTLEKIFAEEIKKAKKRSTSRTRTTKTKAAKPRKKK
jgi:hypothetical protein